MWQAQSLNLGWACPRFCPREAREALETRVIWNLSPKAQRRRRAFGDIPGGKSLVGEHGTFPAARGSGVIGH